MRPPRTAVLLRMCPVGEGGFSKSKSKGLFPEEVEMDISWARITEDSIAMFSVLMSPFHKWLKEFRIKCSGF